MLEDDITPSSSSPFEQKVDRSAYFKDMMFTENPTKRILDWGEDWIAQNAGLDKLSIEELQEKNPEKTYALSQLDGPSTQEYLDRIHERHIEKQYLDEVTKQLAKEDMYMDYTFGEGRIGLVTGLLSEAVDPTNYILGVGLNKLAVRGVVALSNANKATKLISALKANPKLGGAFISGTEGVASSLFADGISYGLVDLKDDSEYTLAHAMVSATAGGVIGGAMGYFFNRDLAKAVDDNINKVIKEPVEPDAPSRTPHPKDLGPELVSKAPEETPIAEVDIEKVSDLTEPEKVLEVEQVKAQEPEVRQQEPEVKQQEPEQVEVIETVQEPERVNVEDEVDVITVREDAEVEVFEVKTDSELVPDPEPTKAPPEPETTKAPTEQEPDVDMDTVEDIEPTQAPTTPESKTLTQSTLSGLSVPESKWRRKITDALFPFKKGEEVLLGNYKSRRYFSYDSKGNKTGYRLEPVGTKEVEIHIDGEKKIVENPVFELQQELNNAWIKVEGTEDLTRKRDLGHFLYQKSGGETKKGLVDTIALSKGHIEYEVQGVRELSERIHDMQAKKGVATDVEDIKDSLIARYVKEFNAKELDHLKSLDKDTLTEKDVLRMDILEKRVAEYDTTPAENFTSVLDGTEVDKRLRAMYENSMARARGKGRTADEIFDEVIKGLPQNRKKQLLAKYETHKANVKKLLAKAEECLLGGGI